MTTLPLTTTVPTLVLARIVTPRPSTMKRLAGHTRPTALLIPDDTLYALYFDVSPSLPDQILRAVAPQGVRIDTDPAAFTDAHPCVEQLIHDLIHDMGSSSRAWTEDVA